MLRLHRLGTFAATFGLMVLGSSLRGEDDPFAQLMPRKVGSSACFHRDYDAAHLKRHPRQATQSIVMSLKYEIPESLHPSARVMMRRKGTKEPFYVAAGCGWGEHSVRDAKAAQRLLGAMRAPSGLDCTAIEFTTSAREAGFFTIDLSKPAPDLALGPQDRVFRLERTNPSACKTLDDGLPTAAAQRRIVSVARIRQDLRKSARPFKGIIFPDISKFESDMPSQAVRSPRANM